MDQNRQLKSIEEVQEAETYSTKKIADAEKEKERIVSDARHQAATIVADAISQSKQKRDAAIKKFASEIEDKKKKALEKAIKESKSIRSRRLSAQKRSDLVGRLVKIIVGG
jgi:vacuolar-type H+-ATPase subunit H